MKTKNNIIFDFFKSHWKTLLRQFILYILRILLLIGLVYILFQLDNYIIALNPFLKFNIDNSIVKIIIKLFIYLSIITILISFFVGRSKIYFLVNFFWAGLFLNLLPSNAEIIKLKFITLSRLRSESEKLIFLRNLNNGNEIKLNDNELKTICDSTINFNDSKEVFFSFVNEKMIQLAESGTLVSQNTPEVSNYSNMLIYISVILFGIVVSYFAYQYVFTSPLVTSVKTSTENLRAQPGHILVEPIEIIPAPPRVTPTSPEPVEVVYPVPRVPVIFPENCIRHSNMNCLINDLIGDAPTLNLPGVSTLTRETIIDFMYVLCADLPIPFKDMVEYQDLKGQFYSRVKMLCCFHKSLKTYFPKMSEE